MTSYFSIGIVVRFRLGLLGISELQFGKELAPRYKTSQISVPEEHRFSCLREKRVKITTKEQDNDFFGRINLAPFPSSGHFFALPLYWNVYLIYKHLNSCLFPVHITEITIL